MTSGADSGPGTLREALESANNRPGEDTVSITAGLSILLEDYLQVTDHVRILGNGSKVSYAHNPSGDPVFYSDRGAGISASDLALDLLGDRDPAEMRGSGVQFTEVPTVPVSFSGMDFALGERGYGIDLDTAGGPGVTLAVKESKFRGGDYGIAVSRAESGTAHRIDVDGVEFYGQGSAAISTDNINSEAGGGGLSVRNSVFEGISREGNGSAPIRIGPTNHPAGSGSPQVVIESTRFVGNGGRQSSALTVQSGAVNASTADEPFVLMRNVSISDSTVGVAGDYSQLLNVSGDGEDSFGAVIENSTIVGETDVPFAGGYGEFGMEREVIALHHVTASGVLGGYVNFEISNSVIDSGEQSMLQWDWDGPLTATGAGNVLTADAENVEALVVPSVMLGLKPLGGGGSGQSYVRVPEEWSPVVDAAEVDLGIDTDQRGVARSAGAAADAGAVELQGAMFAVGDAATVEAGADAVFPVSVVSPGERAAEIELTTSDETASVNVHYSATRKTLQFAAGDTLPQEVRVPTLPGAGADGTAFLLTGIVKGGGALIDPAIGRAVLTLAVPVREALGLVTGPGVVNAGEPAVFDVSLTSPSDSEVTLRVVTSDRDGVAGRHYDSFNSTLTFPAGEVGSQKVSIPTLNADDVNGRSFALQVTVESGNAVLSPSSAIATIQAVIAEPGADGHAQGGELSKTGAATSLWLGFASLLIVGAGVSLVARLRRR